MTIKCLPSVGIAIPINTQDEDINLSLVAFNDYPLSVPRFQGFSDTAEQGF